MFERLFQLAARGTNVAVQLLLGRPCEVHPLMYGAAAAFAADFLVAQ